MKTTELAQLALDKLVNLFSSQELAKQVSFTYIQTAGRPSDNWSFGNQILQMLAGTSDGRTYLAWQEAGRQVMKGAKAFYILQPIMVQKKEQDRTGKETTRPILVGFKAAPRFRVEDTEIVNPDKWQKASQEYKPKELPPLANVAQAWSIAIKYDQTRRGEEGSFNPDAKEIRLCVQEPETFFHELAHAGQLKLDGQLKPGQDTDQEIIAEFTAAVLSEMYGYDSKGASYQYIKGYAEAKTPEQVGRACLKVLDKVKRILDLILTTDEQTKTATTEQTTTKPATVAAEPVISPPIEEKPAEQVAEIVILADTRGKPETADLANFGIVSEKYHSRPAKKEDTEIKPDNLNQYIEAAKVKPLSQFA